MLFLFFFASITWFGISSSFFPQNLLIWVVVAPFVFLFFRFLLPNLSCRPFWIHLLHFAWGFLKSFAVAVQVIVWMLSGKVFQGLVEFHPPVKTPLASFFLRWEITLVPDSYFIAFHEDQFLLHRIASNAQKAHERMEG